MRKLVPRLRLIFLFSSLFLSVTSAFTQSSNAFRVFLDPGHGGKDPGNMHHGYVEKKITLAVALKVGAILSKEPNIEVYYSRKDDRSVDLYARGPMANKLNADVFVSIHCDAHDSNASGAGTFVLGLHRADRNLAVAQRENAVIYNEENYQSRYANFNSDLIAFSAIQEENLDQSIRLASFVQREMVRTAKRRDRQVKQAGFVVLYETIMPSVLVETGFLSNADEGAFLNSTTGQDLVAKAMATAILTYRDEIALNTLASAPSFAKTVYAVQLFATDKTIPVSDPRFSGLNPIWFEEKAGLKRYFYGEASSEESGAVLKKKAIEKGFTDAFVVKKTR
ncbi:MAG: hypothetical protein RLZZ242_586 [Bacteroidota bacterium]